MGTARLVHEQNDWLRYSLPYHFQKLCCERFKHVYLPVNRRGLPLGMIDGDVRYQDYLPQAFVFDSDPHHFEDVWFEPIGLYLYGDGPDSKRGYGERLQRLAAHRSRIFGLVR